MPPPPGGNQSGQGFHLFLTNNIPAELQRVVRAYDVGMRRLTRANKAFQAGTNQGARAILNKTRLQAASGAMGFGSMGALFNNISRQGQRPVGGSRPPRANATAAPVPQPRSSGRSSAGMPGGVDDPRRSTVRARTAVRGLLDNTMEKSLVFRNKSTGKGNLDHAKLAKSFSSTFNDNPGMKAHAQAYGIDKADLEHAVRSRVQFGKDPAENARRMAVAVDRLVKIASGNGIKVWDPKAELARYKERIARKQEAQRAREHKHLTGMRSDARRRLGWMGYNFAAGVVHNNTMLPDGQSLARASGQGLFGTMMGAVGARSVHTSGNLKTNEVMASMLASYGAGARGNAELAAGASSSAYTSLLTGLSAAKGGQIAAQGAGALGMTTEQLTEQFRGLTLATREHRIGADDLADAMAGAQLAAYRMGKTGDNAAKFVAKMASASATAADHFLKLNSAAITQRLDESPEKLLQLEALGLNMEKFNSGDSRGALLDMMMQNGDAQRLKAAYASGDASQKTQAAMLLRGKYGADSVDLMGGLTGIVQQMQNSGKSGTSTTAGLFKGGREGDFATDLDNGSSAMEGFTRSSVVANDATGSLMATIDKLGGSSLVKFMGFAVQAGLQIFQLVAISKLLNGTVVATGTALTATLLPAVAAAGPTIAASAATAGAGVSGVLPQLGMLSLVLLAVGAAAVGVGYGFKLALDAGAGFVKEVTPLFDVLGKMGVNEMMALGPALANVGVGFAAMGVGIAAGMLAINAADVVMATSGFFGLGDGLSTTEKITALADGLSRMAASYTSMASLPATITLPTLAPQGDLYGLASGAAAARAEGSGSDDVTDLLRQILAELTTQRANSQMNSSLGGLR